VGVLAEGNAVGGIVVAAAGELVDMAGVDKCLYAKTRP